MAQHNTSFHEFSDASASIKANESEGSIWIRAEDKGESVTYFFRDRESFLRFAESVERTAAALRA